MVETITSLPSNNVNMFRKGRTSRLRLKTAIKLLTMSSETLHRCTMQKSHKFGS